MNIRHNYSIHTHTLSVYIGWFSEGRFPEGDPINEAPFSTWPQESK